MSKKITNYRNIAIIALLLEVLAAILIGSIINISWWQIVVVLVAVQNVFFGLFVYWYTKQFELNQVEISSVLNEDASHSIVFGKVGLVHYDENRNVIWNSELLDYYHFNLKQVKLLEWQPELEKTFEEEEIINLEIQDKCFEVYNNQTTRTLYFRDITDYSQLNRSYIQEKTVIGYLCLDNYDECIANIDETKVSNIQSTMRNNIVNWANEFGVMVRRFKSDSYILLMNEETYQKLANNRFTILNKIKQDANDLGIIMTLSIGIARHFDSIKEADEAAVNALNLAFSRGGDQVVIKSNIEPIKFFGGNSESNNTSSRVVARVKAKSLNGLIASASNVIIMGHKLSDLDSLGASIGVHKIVESLEIKNHIVVNMDSIEEKTGRVASLLKKDELYKNIIVSPKQALELVEPKTLLVLVDNHKESLAIEPELLHRIKNIVVIDHHRRSEEFINSTILTYLEPSASSCVELITELFDYQDSVIKLTEKEATIMYAGMLVDTNYFRTRVGVQTLQTASKLKELGMNVALAYEYLEDDYEEVKLRISIMQKAYRFKPNIIIAYCDDIEVKTAVLAKVGNTLLDTAGIDAVFTVGKVAFDRVAISARSSRNINVQMIMESLGGGGHFGMAACQIKDIDVETAIQRLEVQIKDYLAERED